MPLRPAAGREHLHVGVPTGLQGCCRLATPCIKPGTPEGPGAVVLRGYGGVAAGTHPAM